MATPNEDKSLEGEEFKPTRNKFVQILQYYTYMCLHINYVYVCYKF